MNIRVWGLLGVAAIFMVAAVGALFLNLNRFRDSFAWVQHTNSVLREIASSEAALLRAESGERGYVLSGDESYRQSYEHAQGEVLRSLDSLGGLLADNDVQAENLRTLRTLRTVVEARLKEFKEVMDLGPGRRAEALLLLGTARERRLTQQVRMRLEQMRSSEETLLIERQHDADVVAGEMAGLSSAMTILAILATAFGAYLLERQHVIGQLRAADLRTAELQSELLHVSRLSSMGEMASALAHELNQPMTAIANYLRGAKRLLDGPVDGKVETVKEALDMASAQALRAGEVIRRLRSFVGRGEAEKQIESLGKLAREATALALIAAKDEAVDVDYELDPAADLVLVDGVQIQQVLLNLVRNGIEAMKGQPRRRLVVASRPAEGDMVAIEVIDSGTGIAPEIAARLFQPFQTTKPSGMGVGLSICRTIVEAHGGNIEARPNPDGGTIFRFTLRSGAEPQEPGRPNGANGGPQKG